MGDFNGRSSSLVDFAEIDKDIFDQMNVDLQAIFVSDPVSDEIVRYGINVKGTSQDKRTKVWKDAY